MNDLSRDCEGVDEEYSEALTNLLNRVFNGGEGVSEALVTIAGALVLEFVAGVVFIEADVGELMIGMEAGLLDVEADIGELIVGKEAGLLSVSLVLMTGLC
jgi:hypothetical protein